MEKQETEINLSDIFYLLLSKLHFIILLAVLGMLVGFSYAKFVLPVKYTSSISIYVNASEKNQQSDSITSTELTTARSLTSTYIVVLQNDIVYDQVSEKLFDAYNVSDLEKVFNVSYESGEPYISASQIKSVVSIESVDETEVISISATTENPELSASICTYISEIAPDLLATTTHAGTVEPIGTAKIPSSPSSPNVKKITAVGFLLGFVIAVAVIIILDLIDNRVKTSDDFKKKFENIPVLAEIPDMSENDKGGSTYEYN